MNNYALINSTKLEQSGVRQGSIMQTSTRKLIVRPEKVSVLMKAL